MKILFIWYFPFQQGGVESFLLDFVRAIVAQGHEIAIAATRSTDGPMKDEFLRAEGIVFNWTSFTAGFYGDRVAAQTAKERVLVDLINFQPEVIIINDCVEFGIGAAPLLRQVSPYSYIVDVLHVDYTCDRLRVRRHYMDCVDGVISVNMQAIRRFTEVFRFFNQQYVRFIPAGVPFTGNSRTSDLSCSSLNVLYVGRIQQALKRVFDLVDIFGGLQLRSCAFNATVIGDGPDLQALKDLIKKRGLSKNVRFTGYQPPDRVRQEYQNHDILLNVSDIEGTPRVVLEAMRAGCIPVCSNLSYTELLIDSGRNGFVCPVGDANAFCDTIVNIPKAEIAKFKRAAQETANIYSIERTIQSYFELFEALSRHRQTQPWSRRPLLTQWPGLQKEWDLSRNNPWIPHPSFARRLFHSSRELIREVLNRW